MTLNQAVQSAIDSENQSFLRNTQALVEASNLGSLYRRAQDARDKGFVQKPYPQETLEQFCERAGT